MPRAVSVVRDRSVSYGNDEHDVIAENAELSFFGCCAKPRFISVGTNFAERNVRGKCTRKLSV